MPKCKGHIHILDEEGNHELYGNGAEKVKLCESELRNVGFIRGEDGGVEERYVCDNEECSRYRDNQRMPHEP